MIGVGLFQSKNPNYKAEVGMRADFRPNGFTVASGEIVAVGKTGITVRITFTVTGIYREGVKHSFKMNDTDWQTVREDAW